MNFACILLFFLLCTHPLISAQSFTAQWPGGKHNWYDSPTIALQPDEVLLRKHADARTPRKGLRWLQQPNRWYHAPNHAQALPFHYPWQSFAGSRAFYIISPEYAPRVGAP